MKAWARELVINVVVFAVVIVLGGAYLAFGVYGWRPGTRYSEVTMSISNTDLVMNGTGVFVNGIHIGEVSAVDLNPQGARLTLRFPTDQHIPADSTVEIGMQSALGEPYVNFVPASSGGADLADGAVIAADHIDQPESIPGIFDLISDLSTVASAGPMAGVLRTVWQALDGTDEAMGRISDGSRLIAGVLLSREAKLRTMFVNTQTYTGDLGWLIDEMPGFGKSLNIIFVHYLDTLHTLETTFGKSDLYHQFSTYIDPFLQKLTSYLSDIMPNMSDAIGPLMPIVSAVNQTLPQIDVSDLLSRALELFGSGDSARFVINPSK